MAQTTKAGLVRQMLIFRARCSEQARYFSTDLMVLRPPKAKWSWQHKYWAAAVQHYLLALVTLQQRDVERTMFR